MTEPIEDQCQRCGHPAAAHPKRYVCDEYPHPDPLQLCGCAAVQHDSVCRDCGHGAKSHKPRTRCASRTGDGVRCICWGFEKIEEWRVG
jgi:hypothetical protein